LASIKALSLSSLGRKTQVPYGPLQYTGTNVNVDLKLGYDHSFRYPFHSTVNWYPTMRRYRAWLRTASLSGQNGLVQAVTRSGPICWTAKVQLSASERDFSLTQR
jgi:hypothetical protein